MKKRIITSWLVVLGVMLLVSLSLLLLYISPWARGKSERLFLAQSGFECGADTERDGSLSIIQKTKDDAAFEYSVHCTEIRGSIVFKVYYVHDMPGMTDEEKFENVRQLHKRGASDLVLEREIDEIGTYRFDLSDGKNGFYISCIETAKPGTQAKGTEELRVYDSNWSVLMDRIGIR